VTRAERVHQMGAVHEERGSSGSPRVTHILLCQMGANRMGPAHRWGGPAQRVLKMLVLCTLFLTIPALLIGCGGTMLIIGGPIATSIPPHTHVAGEDCSPCHKTEHGNWAMSLHGLSASDALLNVEHNKAEVVTNECLHCMAPFQEKLGIRALITPVDTKGPWKLLPAASQWQSISCEVCHDPSSSAPRMLAFYNGTTGSYEQVPDVTTLCEKCHQSGTDDSRDVKGSVHDGIGCEMCHVRSQMNFDPTCGQCHPAIGPGKHPDVTTLDTTYKDLNSKNNIHFVTCKSCHPKSIPPLVEQAKQ